MNQNSNLNRRNVLVFIVAVLMATMLSYVFVDWLKASLFVDYGLRISQSESADTSIERDIDRDDATELNCDVLVAGGGAGGVSAAIQSARMGTKTCLVEETDWLGGMLTSAGVSGIDGRPDTPSGIFKELIDRVHEYYISRGEGGAPYQCSVSYMCFEPSVGNKVFNEMVSETRNLSVYYNSKIEKVYRDDDLITGVRFSNNGSDFIAKTDVVIDATEFGDLMYMADIDYDLGIDKDSREPHAEEADSCIQPLTYVAILQKGHGDGEPVEAPADYDREDYRCTIKSPLCPDSNSLFDKRRLLHYGKMPNDKLMINIPSHSYGNDFHATSDELDNFSREAVLEMSKKQSQGYIHFIQSELGMDDYGIYNEFGTEDSFAKIPYVRESRRLDGVERMTEWSVLPGDNDRSDLRKDAIAIGDYPIDLHFCSTGIGDVFHEIPPYQIPYGVTVPKKVDGFLVTEKNISVSHIVNGTTRLQPVVMSVGQAVGAAASLSSSQNIAPRNVNITELQDVLLDAGSDLFFFTDVDHDHYANAHISKLAVKGYVSGYSDLSFRPENTLTRSEMESLMNSIYLLANESDSGVSLSHDSLFNDSTMPFFSPADEEITRGEVANLIASHILKSVHIESGITAHYWDVYLTSPYFLDIQKLAYLGIINPNNSYFRPDAYATRAETVVMLMNALGL